MLTAYDPELAKIDEEWLLKAGTAYAVAFYEQECYKILNKTTKAEECCNRIAALLNEQNDPEGELDEYIAWATSSLIEKLRQQLQIAENKLCAVNAHEWVDDPKPHLRGAIMRDLGVTRLITKDEFENNWQKTEAGY